MTDFVIETTAQLVRAIQRMKERKWSFLGIFVVVCIAGVVMLDACGLVPNILPVVSKKAEVVVVATSTPASIEEPVKIGIAKIGLSASVENPTTTDVATLDAGLLKGAVRYPTSAKLGENGNVVLFAHSSYLPIVGNQAYKTFNGIQKLTAGDSVTVSSSGTAYTYRVKSVEKKSAESDAGISLAVSGRVLTLATCDSFGKKSDRFIVTADFVESHSILF